MNNTVWIVEPYAEMRGENETKPTATSVFPVDYQYVRWSNRNFEQFVTLINEFPGLSIPANQYPDRIKDLYDGLSAED